MSCRFVDHLLRVADQLPLSLNGVASIQYSKWNRCSTWISNFPRDIFQIVQNTSFLAKGMCAIMRPYIPAELLPAALNCTNLYAGTVQLSC